MKILVIEENKTLSDYMKKGLSEAGFLVENPPDRHEGCRLALTETYDLIILDIISPDNQNWKIIQETRKVDQTVPIIMLSIPDKDESRIKGLELGANDYLDKPFSFSGLLKHVHALLRLNTTTFQDYILHSDIHLNPIQHQAIRDGNRIQLTAKEFHLLEYLMYHHGEVVSRSRIAVQIWGKNFGNDTNIIDTTMKRLRSKIDKPFATKLISTVRGTGFIFNKPIARS